MLVPKKTTDKKRAANRRNAQRSTGPRTQRGKTLSRFNAVKHGLFAKLVVIPDVDDEPEDFPKLLADLTRTFQPAGSLEEFCVVEMAKSMWRTRRATQYERGSVRADTVGSSHAPQPGVLLCAGSNGELLLLLNAHKEIDDGASLSPATYAKIAPLLEGTQPRPGEVPPLDDAFRLSLEEAIRDTQSTTDYLLQCGDQQVKDFYNARAIPDPQHMDALLRYENAAEKRFDWALKTLLEVQQRRRSAEHVEPQRDRRPPSPSPYLRENERNSAQSGAASVG